MFSKLTLLSLIAVVCAKSNDAEIPSNYLNPNEVVGSRLEWVYERNGIAYYMTPKMQADVIDSPRQRFNVSTEFIPTTTEFNGETTTNGSPTDDTAEPTSTPVPTEPTTDDTTGPQPIPGASMFQTGFNEFVAIINSSLSKYSDASQFFMVPVEEGSNQFHLLDADTQEFIVSPRTRAPFDFFLQKLYPLEPPATFYFMPYKFHLNSSYGGVRENIESTLEEIGMLDTELEKLAAFSALIQQMITNNHVTGGQEIFIVGRYIQLNIPNFVNSVPFSMLPNLTQLIIEGVNVENSNFKLYLTNESNLFPVSIVTSHSRPAPIFPFNFMMLSTSTAVFNLLSKWSTSSFWNIDGNGNLITSSTRSQFELHFLENSTDYFHIKSGSRFLHTVLDGSSGNYKFCNSVSCQNNSRATFTISRYQVLLSEMYSENNRQDIPTVAEIIGTYTPNSTVSDAFVQLIEQMTLNNHITGGPEAFSVARYIRTYVPNYLTSQPFQMLPNLTRLIIPGAFSGAYTNFQLFLQDTPAQELVPLTGIIGITKPRPIYAYQVKALTSFGFAIFITTGTSGSHWRLVSNRLETTPAQADSAIFQLHFPAETTDYVHLYYNNQFLKYFADSDGNYKFCINCGEANQTARVTVTQHQVVLGQMYNPENQADIPELALVIYKYENTTPAADGHFTELINLMRLYGHVRGKEIFTLGAFIKDLIGDASTSFALLPRPVQLVCSSNLTWTFVKGGAEYPIKYYWASDLHENIQQYEFRWRQLTGTSIPRVLFDIIYGDGVEQLQQLLVNPATKELTQRLHSGLALFEFELQLEEDLDSFTINWDKDMKPIVTLDEMPDFYFQVHAEPLTEPTTEASTEEPTTTDVPTDPTTGFPTDEPSTNTPTDAPTEAPTTSEPNKPDAAVFKIYEYNLVD